MAIKIVVDTNSRSNPSNNKREYVLNTHPLFKIDNVTDILKIEKNIPKITRNIGINENGTIYVLDTPYEETFNQLKLELFKGANYIYIDNVYNNDMTLEYLVDSDMNNNYVSDINFGTKITQNSEAVQIAWNQISQYIKFEGIDDKASFSIYDEDNQQLMVMNQYGMNFFANNEKFGDMGVHTIGNKKYIAFSVDGEYGETATDGMAWGVTTKSDKAFKPIFYIENFDVAPEASDAYYGQLVLGMCDLVLAGIGTGIISGNIKMTGDDLLGVLTFTDTNTDSELLKMFPKNDIYEYTGLQMLDGAIKFFKNIAGTYTFKMDSNLYLTGKVYTDQDISDEREKENIQPASQKALDIINQIQHKEFDMKKDKSHFNIGYIAQELEKIDKNFVNKVEASEFLEEKYYVNQLPILATVTKAIQEQQQQIEELQKQINELKGEK